MNLRVLMVISQWHPLRGGAEQQARALARSLQQRGITITVLTGRMPGLPRHETTAGVSVHRRILTLPWGKWFGLTYLLSTLWFLLRQRHTYDIIHCHLAHGLHTPAALMLKALCGKKVIVKIGATGPLSDFKILTTVSGGGFVSRQLRHADRIITLCGQATAESRRAGIPAERIEQIPNGVDTNTFLPAATPLADRTVTCIGRLDFMKGIHVLLRAFQGIAASEDGIILQIVGDGPDRDKLAGLTRELGLQERVRFCGVQEDICAVLQRTAVFVLPSLSEGLSNVVLEAMACGLPIVATRAGGTPELIRDDHNGLLVDPDQPGPLREALLRLLQDPDLSRRLGAAARATAVDQFDINQVADRYLQLYRRIMHTNA